MLSGRARGSRLRTSWSSIATARTATSRRASCRAASLKPNAGWLALPAGNWAMLTVASGRACRQGMAWIHCGRKVATTNRTATKTVTT